MHKSLLTATLLAFGAVHASPAAALPPSITLPQGAVQGTSTSLPDSTVHQYLGIPYAQPPPRFEVATPIGESDATVDATSWKSKCVQTDTGSASMLDNEVDDSEDCLYVNIYAPESASTQRNKTVLVWVYGGGLQTGNAGRSEYDGSSFAANQDIILVSFNYRLNVFGFSNSPSVDASQVNAGFHDQRLALEWIYANIASFGGNPESITIMGESSGAASVDRLVLNPPDVPLRGAIMQSGQASLSASADHNGAQKWQQLVGALNCTNEDQSVEFSCMQSANATVIKETVEQLSLNFFPINDNITQSATPLKDAIKDGKGAHIPLLVGTNDYEGSSFVGPYLQNAIDSVGNVNTTMLASTIEGFGILPDSLTGIIKPYLDTLLLVSPDHLLKSLSSIVTSLIFKCPAMEAAHAHLYASDAPVYRYLFSATFPNTQQSKAIAELNIMDIGAYHSSEIPIVFGTYGVYDSVAPSTDDERALSKVMQRYWANFAKDPQNPDLEGWNKVSHSHINDMVCFGCEGHETGLKSMSELEIDGDCLVFNNLLTADMPLF